MITIIHKQPIKSKKVLALVSVGAIMYLLKRNEINKMLKFTKSGAAYTANTNLGNEVVIEKHCEENVWVFNILDWDGEEVDGWLDHYKTKKEAVFIANQYHDAKAI